MTYWTEQEIDWKGVASLEVAACREGTEEDGRGYVERILDHHPEGDTPALFSVYVYRTGKGAECIADRDTYRQARGLADSLANVRQVPIHDLTPPRLRGV